MKLSKHMISTASQLQFKLIGSAQDSLQSRAAQFSAEHQGRPYQHALSRDIVAALENPLSAGRPSNRPASTTSMRAISSALVVVPTGGGKTHIALATARTLQVSAGLTIGWCSARRDLLRQVDRENKVFGFNVDLRLMSLFDRNPPECDVLIMDEAHHDACASAATLHANVKPSYIMGLTATPWRSDRARLCYSHVIRRCSIQSLQDDGYLAPYAHVSIDSWAPEEVAKTWLRSRERFGKTVIFMHTRQQAHACMLALRKSGVSVELVAGDTDRSTQLQDFASGKVEILLAMGCLTEGFNDPTLQTVFIRPASKGPTVQMGGRAFRMHLSIPVKTIVQHRDTPLPFTRIARPVEQYVIRDSEWRSIGATRQLDALVHNMRTVAARATVVLPTFVTKARKNKSTSSIFRKPDPNEQE